jgi:ubiquinone/menaquinone biosynthesis C-methylase UbiE
MRIGAPAARSGEWLRRFYDNYAPDYDRWMDVYDRRMLGDGRERVCSRAVGQTLEIGVGTGLNLAFYPPDVELTGIDQSPGMLAVAGRRAEVLGRNVELRLGDAQNLDFPSDRFDTVVATLLLSTVPNDEQTAAEVWRVLKPGGQFLVLDHVRSPVRLVRWAERLVGVPMTRFAGVDLLRDPLDYLSTIGFGIERCNRSKWGIVEELVARKDPSAA